jgi:hypothetical protein
MVLIASFLPASGATLEDLESEGAQTTCYSERVRVMLYQGAVWTERHNAIGTVGPAEIYDWLSLEVAKSPRRSAIDTASASD